MIGLVALILARPGNLPGQESAPASLKIIELKVEPSALTLHGPRDVRHFVVRGKGADGSFGDLTRAANSSVQGVVARLRDGCVEPLQEGKAEVVIKAAGLEARLPVTVTALAPVPVRF
ncbi:MAG: hypothetical protein AB7K24_34230, partial [Gemmataceae bacterium]